MSAEVIGTRYHTRSLFWEISQDKSRVRFTLKRKDYKIPGTELIYPSIYRLYFEMEDILEYDFANKYFDNLEHWEEVCKSTYVKDHVTQMRKELELQVRSKALKHLKDQAVVSPDGKLKADINKYLLNRGWIDKTTNTKGRPSKEDIKQELQRVTAVEKELQEDFERIH